MPPPSYIGAKGKKVGAWEVWLPECGEDDVGDVWEDDWCTGLCRPRGAGR